MSSFRYILVTLLKILVVISLVIILFVVGTMIGYGLIGNGNQWMSLMKKFGLIL